MLFLRQSLTTLALCAALAGASSARQGDAPPEARFRERVLPILERRCFECHGTGAKRIRGGLLMSGRDALLAGGDSGPAIVPGDPDASLLVRAVRYEDPDLEMPPKTRLADEEVAELEQWVADGAPWPAAPEPTEAEREALRFFEDEVRPLLSRRCFECHGPSLAEVKSELRMSGRAALLAGGVRGPAIAPGDPDASLLVRAVRYGDTELKMPPSGKLEGSEIATLERWIALGAPFPDEAAAPEPQEGIDVDAGRSFWAFRPVERPEVPDVREQELVRNPIDAFVLAKLEAIGLAPNPPADERELVRRAYDDLIGLPPTLEEVEQYVADPAPDKWDRLIDRLLAMPQYGERWGRHWLDVVRFAQTNGYERDSEKPYIWRYRDWVIRALNEDKPFDRFLEEQIAGDELDGADADALVATGFHHLASWDSEPDDKEQAVWDGYDDVLRAIGEGMMGVTVGCARCHDHKFDPIRQSDYYGMLAFVRNVKPYTKIEYSLDSDTLVPLEFTPELERRWDEDRAARVAELQREQRELFEAPRLRLIEAIVAGQSPEVGRAYHKPAAQRTAADKQLLASLTHLAPSDADVQAALTDRERQELFLVQDEEKRTAERSFEGHLPWALVAREGGPEPAPTFVLARGRASTPLEAVEPTFLPVLCADDAASVPRLDERPPDAESTGLRRALAEWIASPEHPTTARVIANRIWQGHFGRGIVRTPNDFGSTGLPPTHPELLDWLASELVARGWSLKALHKLVMQSYAYRASSRSNEGPALAKDPANDLFWRQNARRVDAEALRDAMLAVSGKLSLEAGGRGFFPALSREALAGASKPGDGWEPSSEAQRDRRAVYAYVKRGMLPPFLELFDFADPALPVGARASTTIASQALTLLNSDFASRCARALAERIEREAGDEPAARVRRLFELAVAREPRPEELALALDYLARQTAAFATVPERIELRAKLPQRGQTEFLAALSDDAFLSGPRDGWRSLRGRWGGYYNDTLERDPERGPATLLEQPVFADGVVSARVRLEPGCEVAAIALRARADGGELAGLEVVVDPAKDALRLLAIPDAESEVRELASKPLTVVPGNWYELSIELSGPRVRVALDGSPYLAADGVPITEPGSLGLRAFGDSLLVEGLSIQLGDGRVEVGPDAGPSPSARAFETLCLAAFNLNEFLYVD